MPADPIRQSRLRRTTGTHPTLRITMKDMILGIVRHVLTAAGGTLAGNGVLTDADANVAAGAIITLLGIAWSVWDKKKKAS